MGRIGLRSVRAHAGRFVMSVVAVMLGVAFVTGTFALREMLSSTFDEIVDASTTSDAYLNVPDSQSADFSSQADGTAGIPLTSLDEIEAVDGVAAAFPAVQGPIVLVGADGTAVRSTQAPSFAMEFDPRDTSAHLTGAGPTGPDEIALEQHTLETSGLHVGDTTTVVVLGRAHEVTVTGVVDYASPMAGATIVLLDAATARAAYAPTGVVSTVSIEAEPGVTADTLVQRLSPLADSLGVEAMTQAQMRERTTDQIDEQLGFVSTFLLVFALLAVFVGAFIIANTFSMQVRQRMREFALLRAVGASPAQVFGSIVVQAAVVGAVGAALGVLGGLGLTELVGKVLESMDMTLSASIPLSVSTVVVGVVVGIGVSVVAAALPARRAAVVPPVEAMRDEIATHERSLRVRAIAGSVLLALGAGATVLAAVRPDADSAGLILGLGAAGVVLGVLVLGPVAVPAVVRVLSAPAVAWWRPVGRLARGNVVRNPRRAANTAGALTIGMALVGAAAVLAATTEASIRSVVESEVTADYALHTDYPSTISDDVVSQVDALDDVARVDGYAWTALPVVGPDGERSDGMLVSGIDPTGIGTVITPSELDGDVAGALAAGEAVADTTTAKDEGWAIGDTVEVEGPTGTSTLTIGALMRSSTIGTGLAVSPGVLDELAPAEMQSVNTVSIQAVPGTDLEALRAELVDIVKPYYVVSVMDAGEFVDGIAAQVNQMLAVLYALLGLSIAIAVLGIVNTLALSVIERTKEIGLLRAVGLGRLQLSGVISSESVLTAVCGTVIGLATGVSLAAVLPRLYADEGLTELSVPVGSLLGMLALAVVVGVLAAVWPAVRAARMPVLDAVSHE
jgi:putative ABC transport system permease protein